MYNTLYPPRRLSLGIQVFALVSGGLQCIWIQDVHLPNLVAKANPLAMQNCGFLQSPSHLNQPITTIVPTYRPGMSHWLVLIKLMRILLFNRLQRSEEPQGIFCQCSYQFHFQLYISKDVLSLVSVILCIKKNSAFTEPAGGKYYLDFDTE